MAKSGVSEGDPATLAVRATELKKELQKLLMAIVDEDDVNLEAVDRAQQMLLTFKELKLKKKAGDLKSCRQETGPGAVPEEFKCPISKELMRDPVIVANGQVLHYILCVYVCGSANVCSRCYWFLVVSGIVITNLNWLELCACARVKLWSVNACSLAFSLLFLLVELRSSLFMECCSVGS